MKSTSSHSSWSAYLLVLTLAGLAIGCAKNPIITVNGLTVYESIWARTVAEVGRRATFATDCAVENFEFTLFKRVGREPTEVGVKGCGHNLLFTRASIGAYVVNDWQIVAHKQATTGEEPASAPDVNQL